MPSATPLVRTARHVACQEWQPDREAATWDARVRMLRTLLEQHPLHALRSVRCDVLFGRIELSGRVGSYYLKQMAQESIRGACVDLQIVNRVDVIQCGDPTDIGGELSARPWM